MRAMKPIDAPHEIGLRESVGHEVGSSGSFPAICLSSWSNIISSGANSAAIEQRKRAPNARATGQSQFDDISVQQCRAVRTWWTPIAHPMPCSFGLSPLEPPPTEQFQSKCFLPTDSNISSRQLPEGDMFALQQISQRVIKEIAVIAPIESEGDFCEVSWQMLGADLVVRSNKAPLEQAPNILNGVNVKITGNRALGVLDG